jgi:hypothetical protein
VEDGKDGTIGLFRRNSGCSAEQKILGIPFRTVPQRRKMLGIRYHGTKLEANARNSVMNHSAEETTTRNSVPKHVSDENSLSILLDGAGFFVKLIFFMPFPSVPSFGIDSSVTSECLGMSTFFRGITQAVPRLFCGIFSERNSAANPSRGPEGGGRGRGGDRHTASLTSLSLSYPHFDILDSIKPALKLEGALL